MTQQSSLERTKPAVKSSFVPPIPASKSPFSSYVLQRLIQKMKRGELHRGLGRFLLVRRLYSLWQNWRQRWNSTFYRDQLKPLDGSMFGSLEIPTCVKQMRQDAVAFGLRLPEFLTHQIYRYACDHPCTQPESSDEFWADQVHNGWLPNDRLALRGLVKAPDQCEAIEKITKDPVLLQIAKDYLGYWPTQITQHLTWSFASNLPEAEKQKHYPPTNYHYDVAGWNFMMINFYITDVDSASGAHVLMKGSHLKKPLHLVFGSCLHPDHVVYQFYNPKDELVITGNSGYGFMEDASCFHKVKAPTKSDRLILQIRYS